MLVLSRRKDEAIIIGDNIEITVVDIKGDQIRLGINAPRSVSVHRKEVYDAIQKENIAAAAPAAPATDNTLAGLAGMFARSAGTEKIIGKKKEPTTPSNVIRKVTPPKKKKNS